MSVYDHVYSAFAGATLSATAIGAGVVIGVIPATVPGLVLFGTISSIATLAAAWKKSAFEFRPMTTTVAAAVTLGSLMLAFSHAAGEMPKSTNYEAPATNRIVEAYQPSASNSIPGWDQKTNTLTVVKGKLAGTPKF
ncbi:MAG: hypothetical protein PSY14_01855 [bacterium]|nr:hypothetical protein [bacterium]